MKDMKSSLPLLLLALGSASYVPAEVLFTSFGPNRSFQAGRSYAVANVIDFTPGSGYGGGWAGDVYYHQAAYRFSVPAGEYALDSVVLPISRLYGSAPVHLAITEDLASGSFLEQFTTTPPYVTAPQIFTSTLRPRLQGGNDYWLTTWFDLTYPDPSSTDYEFIEEVASIHVGWAAGTRKSRSLDGPAWVAAGGPMTPPSYLSWGPEVSRGPFAAFEINGSPVPEPGSGLLAVIGLTALALRYSQAHG